MNTLLEKEAKEMLIQLKGRKNAVECMKRKIACGEGGLEERLRKIQTEVEVTEAAYSGLDYRNRDVLASFFIHREPEAAEKLSKKYCCCKSTVYRMRREAMREFMIMVFGYAE